MLSHLWCAPDHSIMDRPDGKSDMDRTVKLGPDASSYETPLYDYN
jgi:hypothetical protein